MLVKVFCTLLNDKVPCCIDWVTNTYQSKPPFFARILEAEVHVESTTVNMAWNNARLFKALQQTRAKAVVPILFTICAQYDGLTMATHRFLTEYINDLVDHYFHLLLFRATPAGLLAFLPSEIKTKRLPRGVKISRKPPPRLLLVATADLKRTLLNRVREIAL